MGLPKKLPLVFFALSTLLSISLISYGAYLYFEAYNAVNVIKVSIKNINIIYNSPDPDYVSILTNVSILNPTDLSLEFNSLWETLYLNGHQLGQNYYYVQPPFPRLPPRSNVTVSIPPITNVPRNVVDTQSSKIWRGDFYVTIYDIPIVDTSQFFFRAYYPS
jgi:LEA14-like dessication related protein